MGISAEAKNAYNRAYYARKKQEHGEYYKKTRKAYYEKNKESYAQRSQKWYADDLHKLSKRERIHGIDFQEMYEEQEGLCAIGGEALPENLDAIHVDHDHKTGRIRGLGHVVDIM